MTVLVVWGGVVASASPRRGGVPLGVPDGLQRGDSYGWAGGRGAGAPIARYASSQSGARWLRRHYLSDEPAGLSGNEVGVHGVTEYGPGGVYVPSHPGDSGCKGFER